LVISGESEKKTKRGIAMKIVEKLLDYARSKTERKAEDAYKIRGVWTTQLCFQPNENERVFTYTYLLAQTRDGQGCSYCPENIQLPLELAGKDARKLEAYDLPVQIALLDAIYGSIPQKPQTSWQIEGTSLQKTVMRTEIVVWEALRLLRGKDLKRVRIVNAGVVGNFLKELKNRGIGELLGTDFDPALVGKSLGDVPIYSGERTEELVASSDLAIVTGMTLATDTFAGILEAAKGAGTKLLVFAETGANLGPALCQLGVDTVVGEPFPFYIFHGTSTINVFRRELNGK
jgi:hypothetical protein